MDSDDFRVEEVVSDIHSFGEKLEGDSSFDELDLITGIVSTISNSIQGKNDGYFYRHSQNLVMGAEYFTMYAISELGKIITWHLLDERSEMPKIICRDLKKMTEASKNLDTPDWMPILCRAYHQKMVSQKVLQMKKDEYRLKIDFPRKWMDKDPMNENHMLGRLIGSKLIERGSDIFFTWKSLYNCIGASNNIENLFMLSLIHI